jgi:peptidoglycan/LPS O-acetylase OafA/YrhL
MFSVSSNTSSSIYYVFSNWFVGLFLVASGFLVTQSRASSHNVGDFFIRRILRIYPAFIVVTIASHALGYWMADDHAAYLGKLLDHGRAWLVYRIILLQGNSVLPSAYAASPHPGDIDGPLWTIPYEFALYLLLAALWSLRLFQNRWVVLGLFLLMWNLSYSSHDGSGISVPGTPIWFDWVTLCEWACFFLAGATIWHWRDQIHINWALGISSAIVMFGVSRLIGSQVFVPIAGALMLMFVVYSPSIRLNNFGKKNDLSYGIYVWAWPVQQIIICLFGHYLTQWSYTLICLFAANAIAYLSWRYVECPFLLIKQKRKPAFTFAQEPTAFTSVCRRDTNIPVP